MSGRYDHIPEDYPGMRADLEAMFADESPCEPQRVMKPACWTDDQWELHIASNTKYWLYPRHLLAFGEAYPEQVSRWDDEAMSESGTVPVRDEL